MLQVSQENWFYAKYLPEAASLSKSQAFKLWCGYRCYVELFIDDFKYSKGRDVN